MNYQLHYELLCLKRQQLNRKKLDRSNPNYCYYEKHHIIPIHENGSNEASNLVLLTAREHFIAHWLFAKWKQTQKAWACVSIMQMDKHGLRKLSGRQYEICRIASSLANTKRIISDEQKLAISIANKNKTVSKETCIKISNSKKGCKTWNKNLPMKEESKAKLRIANKGTAPPNKGNPMPEIILAKHKIRRESELQAKLSAHLPCALVHRKDASIVHIIASAKDVYLLIEALKLRKPRLIELILGQRKWHKDWIILCH